MHVVCASARVWSLPGGLLPSQQEAEYSFSGFIPTNKQTNKQTKNLSGDWLEVVWRLVYWRLRPRSVVTILKTCKDRVMLGRVIIKDRGCDHHQHRPSKTKVYTCHKPLEGAPLPQNPPWLLWGSYRDPPPYSLTPESSVTPLRVIPWPSRTVFCLSVCWYKTRKSLLCLPPWARSKPPESISIQVA